MKGRLLVAWALALELLLAGCFRQDTGRTTSIGELAGRMFVSSSPTEDGELISLATGSRLSIRFYAGDDPGDENRGFSASAGCNEFGAQITTVSEGRLELEEDLVSTHKGCPDPDLMRQEAWFVRLLREEPALEVEAERLVLSGRSQRAEFLELEGDPRSALIGPTWTIEAVVARGVATSWPKDMQTELVFEETRYHGRVGCVETSGDVKMEIGSIRILSAIRNSCPEMAGLDPDPFSPLGGRLTFERSGDTVALRNDAGDGLDLRARNTL